MDADFVIELTVPHGGVSALEQFLPEFPIALAIGKHDQSNDIVLVQCAVSTVAGFYFEEQKGNVQFYSACVASGHSGAPEDVMRSIYDVFQQANLSHRITRVIHELDTDEEVVSFEARA
jgi:hypothetical protein